MRDLDFESGRFFWVVDPASSAGLSGTRRSQPQLDRVVALGSPGTGARVPVPCRQQQDRSESQSGRYHGPRPAHRQPAAVRPGADGSCCCKARTTTSIAPVSGSRWRPSSTRTIISRSAIGRRRAPPSAPFPRSIAAARGGKALDTLQLIVQPQQGPSLPTFRYEMRQIYRVAGADLDVSTLTVGLTLNRSQRPLNGTAETYLRLLGLATASDATVFDRDNRLFPRSRDPDAAQVVHDYYIVFPHLQPFADHDQADAGGGVRLALPHAALPAPARRGRRPGSPCGFTTTPPAAATARRSTSMRCSFGAGASSCSSAGGSWSAASTTRSPTTSVRSPSSIPTPCSAAARRR